MHHHEIDFRPKEFENQRGAGKEPQREAKMGLLKLWMVTESPLHPKGRVQERVGNVGDIASGVQEVVTRNGKGEVALKERHWWGKLNIKKKADPQYSHRKRQ